MDKFTKQFFGDAKRLQLSSKEKALLWQGISTFASAKQINLSSLEKADSFSAIASHMNSNPIIVPGYSSVFNWFIFHKLVASMMVALLIFSVGGGSVAYASQTAVPGDTLYTVKVDITEPLIDVALSFAPERRAEWERRRLKRRLKEAEYLSSSEVFTQDRRVHLEERIEHRMEKLQEHLDRVPEEHRELIQTRVDDVMKRHQEFLERVQDGTLRPEEVRAFREHVGSIRNRAHEQWGRKPGTRKPGPSPLFDRDEIPEQIRERREELGLPTDRKLPRNRMQPSPPAGRLPM
ncbi:MAG: DUF5667 domain-containing protein, partial [Candidatus Peribacteraceae bacterium]|nr:DUF5667 domain-containing protein [Candidatus Peribacteraceae bacterium]